MGRISNLPLSKDDLSAAAEAAAIMVVQCRYEPSEGFKSAQGVLQRMGSFMGNRTRSAETRPDPTLLAVQIMMSCMSIRDLLQANWCFKWERSYKKEDRFIYDGSDFSIYQVASVVSVKDRNLPEKGSRRRPPSSQLSLLPSPPPSLLLPWQQQYKQRSKQWRKQRKQPQPQQ
jgi:hypothetical protein